MKSGVYYIVNKLDGKRYIGSSKNIELRLKQHFSNLRLGKHVNIHLQRAYDKYGHTEFYGEVAELVQECKLFEAEREHLNYYHRCERYNIGDVCGGDNITNHPDREDIIRRIKATSKARYAGLSDVEKQKMSDEMKGARNPNYGNKWDDALRDKVSGIVKLRFESDPSYAAVQSARMKARWNNMTSDNRAAFSKRRSEIMTDSNPFTGKHHSDETKKILSDKAKHSYANMTIEERTAHPQVVAVEVEGVVYYSLSEASRVTGISPSLLCYRLKSNSLKWEAYRYV